jgi:hypothetical protein
MLSAALKYVLSLCLEVRALALKMPPLFLKLDLFSCSLKNDSTTQEWVCPPTLVDLMGEGEESSHPTVEIR